MDNKADLLKQTVPFSQQKDAIKNERFVERCLKQINTAPNAEEGLRRLLQHLGETLACERVYVFEEMDRQHIRNTYEWCKAGISSGINQLPYLAKKDLFPWYRRLEGGENIIEPDVELLRVSDPLIYEFLKPQKIHSLILSPLMAQGKMIGFLGADNPPSENMKHISVLFDVLSYFVSSLVNQRELQRLREVRTGSQPFKPPSLPQKPEKTVLLVDDSRELLRLNERILRPLGYRILSAWSLQKARTILAETQPDAMVLDIDLPDGNGIDFYRELNVRIPVVFLTARSDEEEVRKGLPFEICAFLTKPYQLEDLQSAVTKAVTKKSCTPTGRRINPSGRENCHIIKNS